MTSPDFVAAAEHRAVVVWEGQGEPITLTIYTGDNEVSALSLSPVRALALAQELTGRAVVAIKVAQWGSPWPG